MASVATTSVNRPTIRSRGVSTQRAASSRAGSWTASHSSFAATEAASIGVPVPPGDGPNAAVRRCPSDTARRSDHRTAGPRVRPSSPTTTTV